MDIKNIILKEHGLLLPISGGHGDSIDTAVKIERVIDVQNAYIECYLNKKKWLKVSRRLMSVEGNRFHKVTVEYLDDDGEEKMIDYFFDITGWFGRLAQNHRF